MKAGDLVWWLQGKLESPGIIVKMKPAREELIYDSSFNPSGMLALVMMPELENQPEWFHECELQRVDY